MIQVRLKQVMYWCVYLTAAHSCTHFSG